MIDFRETVEWLKEDGFCDAAAIGFDDAFIYKELAIEPENRRLESQRLLSREAIKAFEAWQSKTDKTEY